MLKTNLDSLEGVNENFHSLYEKTESGGYRLQVEGLDDLDKLKKKKDIEAEHRTKAENKARELEEQLNKLQGQFDQQNDDKHRNNGDIEALDKSWQEKLSKREAELQGQIESLTGAMTATTVDSVAQSIAAELAVEGSSKVLLPHIKSRLAAEQRDGKFVTVVKDADGKPSALTLDELKQEFANDAAFSHVVVGSKASGGGANGGNNNGGGAAGKTVTRSQFDAFSPQERMDFAKDGGTIKD